MLLATWPALVDLNQPSQLRRIQWQSSPESLEPALYRGVAEARGGYNVTWRMFALPADDESKDLCPAQFREVKAQATFEAPFAATYRAPEVILSDEAVGMIFPRADYALRVDLLYYQFDTCLAVLGKIE